MSAYVENKRHIDALVTAAHEFNRGAMHVWYDGHARYEATDDELGRLLWLENVRSVEARYEDVRESHTN